jgi:hypothetical protein
MPFPLASGSGGAGALNDIPVSPGDVLELRIERTTQYGDFVGVNLMVTAEAQVVPSIGGWGSAVLGSLLVACGAMALRRRTVSPW